jgi:hypothetical protein
MTQEECERLLRYYRAYWLLHYPDGSWMRMEDRQKAMDDDSIRFAAEEFVVANEIDWRKGA